MPSPTLAALAGLALLTAAPDVHAQTNPGLIRYQVTVRQIDGRDGIPARMTCESGRLCLGRMSVSVDGAPRRLFVRGMIDGPYAYFNVRSDRWALRCDDRTFITFRLEAPPASTSHEEGICDPVSAPQNDAPGTRRPVLQTLPPFAVLRIDVRSQDDVSRK